MKKEKEYIFLVDAISALFLSLTIALISVLNNELIQIALYIIVATIYILFLIYLKSDLIRKLIYTHISSVQEMEKNNSRKKLQKDIIPKLQKLHEISNEKEEWIQYYCFWEWYDLATSVTILFDDDKTYNVETKYTLTLDETKIYDYDLKMIAKELLNIFCNCEEFFYICNNFKIKTLPEEINTLKGKLCEILKENVKC